MLDIITSGYQSEIPMIIWNLIGFSLITIVYHKLVDYLKNKKNIIKKEEANTINTIEGLVMNINDVNISNESNVMVSQQLNQDKFEVDKSQLNDAIEAERNAKTAYIKAELDCLIANSTTSFHSKVYEINKEHFDTIAEANLVYEEKLNLASSMYKNTCLDSDKKRKELLDSVTNETNKKNEIYQTTANTKIVSILADSTIGVLNTPVVILTTNNINLVANSNYSK